MNRRRFFQALGLGLGTLALAPFVDVPAVPVLYGDGFHDDTLALRAWGAGLPVTCADTREPLGPLLAYKTFNLREPIILSRQDPVTILGCYFTREPPAAETWLQRRA